MASLCIQLDGFTFVAQWLNGVMLQWCDHKMIKLWYGIINIVKLWYGRIILIHQYGLMMKWYNGFLSFTNS